VIVTIAGILFAVSGDAVGINGERFAILLVCAALLPALMTSNVLSSVARTRPVPRGRHCFRCVLRRHERRVASGGRSAGAIVWLRRIRRAGLTGLRVVLRVRYTVGDATRGGASSIPRCGRSSTTTGSSQSAARSTDSHGAMSGSAVQSFPGAALTRAEAEAVSVGSAPKWCEWLAWITYG
jgi:hypothetical protein